MGDIQVYAQSRIDQADQRQRQSGPTEGHILKIVELEIKKRQASSLWKRHVSGVFFLGMSEWSRKYTLIITSEFDCLDLNPFWHLEPCNLLKPSETISLPVKWQGNNKSVYRKD